MAPPPAQKGKFKPRKPAKKVRPGSSSAADGANPVPDAALSSEIVSDAVTSNPTVAFAPSTDNASKRTGRDASGRGGRGGRGGRDGERGGRGRGRTPMPSGRVFFTGVQKTSASKQKAANASERAAARKTKDADNTEEVVGQLDTAIGAGLAGSKVSKLESDSGDYQQSQFGDDQGDESRLISADGLMYDSDSSKEEDEGRHSSVPPLELPFPTYPLPLGIGSSERPLAYAGPATSSDVAATEDTTTQQDVPEAATSPFVDTQSLKNAAWEENSWFLVQLPTRLPPLLPKSDEGAVNVTSLDDPMDETDEPNADPNQMSAVSELVTPPLAPKSHDNILSNTAPGRIGKIVVYKSGRTVLRLEGPPGSQPIMMNVNEGLTCGFHQQAVIIDPDEAKFIALGDVKKSVVITPDLSSAIVAD